MMTTLKNTIRRIAQKIYRRYRSSSPKASTTNNTGGTPPVVAQERPSVEEQPLQKSSLTIDISFTPNPNACKFDVSQRVASESFSFSVASPPTDHPLAQDLLSIDGITSVFGVHNFITATKNPEETWDNISPKIIDVLQKHLS